MIISKAKTFIPNTSGSLIGKPVEVLPHKVLQKHSMKQTNETKNPTNNGKTLVKRDKKGRVTPGSVLNPTGPKPGYKHMSTILTEALKDFAENSDKTYAHHIIKRLILNALSGKEKSIEMIFDRTEGKVKDEFKGEFSGLIAHGNVGEDKLEGVVDEFLATFKKKLHAKNKKLGD